MAGSDPTGVKQNAFVEANGYAREVVERGFRLRPRTIGLFAVFGVFVPTMIYRGAVMDFVRAARRRSNARWRCARRWSDARGREGDATRAIGTPGRVAERRERRD